MTPEKPSTSNASRFFWLNILAMAVVVFLLIVGTFKGIDLYTHHGEEVIVPNVKGMMPSQAEQMFRDRGLVAKVVSTSYQKGMPSGCILEITPEPGEKVKKGRIIFLTINSINAPLREVPDVTENSSAREAEAQLLTAGFHLTENQMVRGELDWVYGVLYNGRKVMAGEKIPVGSMLTLQIGNGDVESDDQSQDSMTLDEGEVGLNEGTVNTSVPTKSVETKPAATKTEPATKTRPATSAKTSAKAEPKAESKDKNKPAAKQSSRQSEHKTTTKKERKNDDSWF